MENSKQKKMETIDFQLRKTEFQQKAILDNIPDIAWLKDTQGRFIAVNQPFAKACGFKLEEIIGKTDLDIWPRELALNYRADDQEVINSKKRKCVQERLIDQDGGEQWIETIKTPFFDDQGNVIGTTGIARNITLQKNEADRLKEVRAELELRVKVRTAELTSFSETLRKEISVRKKSEEETLNLLSLQNATLDACADGILVVDFNGKVVSYNQRFIELWNIPRDLVLTKSDKRLLEYVQVQLIDPKAFTREVYRLYNSPKEESIDTLKFKDGRVFTRFSIPQKVNNEVVGRVWSFRDVTEVRMALEALRVSEEKFRTIVDYTYDWEYWQGADGKMIYVSPSCERISEYTSNDFLKDADLIIKIVHPDDVKILLGKIKEAVCNQTKLETDFRIITRNGHLRWVNHICVPVFSKNGIPLGRRASNRDITLNKQYENELKTYRENLEIIVEKRTKDLEIEIDARKKIEEKAHSLHQQLEFILGATKTGLDIIDQNFNLRYVDPAWARNYGDWTGKKCYEYFMGRRTFCPECAIEKAFKTKKQVVSEEVLAREGNRPIQIISIPYQDENGEWLVAEVNIDITQRKKLDEELKLYHNNLENLVTERTKELLLETNRYKKAELENSKLNNVLIKINEKLKSVSLIDAHTGLFNYRYLQEVIEVEFHQARRYAQNLTVIMLDIDYFKSINDVYGIVFGDLVLKQLARQLRRMVRRYDVLVRYSGEEFIIISPRLNRDAGVTMAQRLLDVLNFINFGDKKHKVKLKLSLSVISFPDDRVKNGMDLVNLADRLLNKAKELGGNRVISSLDILNPLTKAKQKSPKTVGIKTLKNTINKLNKQSKQGLSESIFAFAKTLELKDHYTGEHVENTVHFATQVAKELNLPKEDVELIKQAAMLHDLGKIGISESILLKKGKLNKKEFAEIKKHPQIGADIIRPIQFLHSLIPFIFYHHEHWDGKGYPTGIKGEDIPLGARVIAIADVYQALTSDRPYHKAFTKKLAIEIIKKSSGTQFDPRIVSAFLRVANKERYSK